MNVLNFFISSFETANAEGENSLQKKKIIKNCLVRITQDQG